MFGVFNVINTRILLKPSNIIFGLTITFVVALYYGFSMAEPICLGDCQSYTVLMGKAKNGEYISTFFSMWRSWVIPAFYSLFGEYDKSVGRLIVQLQTAIGILSWVLLSASIAMKFGGGKRKLIFTACIFLCFTKQYYIYNKFIQSDSLALSLVILFIALNLSFDVLWVRSRFFNILYILLALICAGARDSNVMIVVAGVGYLLIMGVRSINKIDMALIVAFVMAIAALQMHSASSRHLVNMAHIITGFIIPNEAPRTFFFKNGWPGRDLQYEGLHQENWCSANYINILRGEYKIKLSDEEVNWGRGLYMDWILQNPYHFVKSAISNRSCILGQSFTDSISLKYYEARVMLSTSASDRWVPPASDVYVGGREIGRLYDYIPLDLRLIGALFLCVFLVSISFNIKSLAYMDGVFVSGLGVINSVVSYFSDLWEPAEMLRHSMIGAVLFEVGLALMIVHALHFILVARAKLVYPA